MVPIPASSLQLIRTSCRLGNIIIWRPPTSCERHNFALNSTVKVAPDLLISSTGCTCYLHRRISSFDSLPGSEVNMQQTEVCATYSLGKIPGCSYTTGSHGQILIFCTIPSGSPFLPSCVYPYILVAWICWIRLFCDRLLLLSLHPGNGLLFRIVKDYFDIVAGAMQGNTLAPYLFIICLDYMLRISTDKMKENDFKLTKKRRRYPAQTLTDTDYADDIALLANAPAQAT